MDIKIVKNLSPNSVLIFFITEDTKMEKQSLFRILEKGDREYLKNNQHKFSIQKGSNSLLVTPSGKRAIILGLEKKSKLNHRKILILVRRIIWFARKERIKELALNFDDLLSLVGNKNLVDIMEAMAVNIMMANFEFNKYQSSPDKLPLVENIEIIKNRPTNSLVLALKMGVLIGEEINESRILSNTPGGDMTPKKLAQKAEDVGKKWGIKVGILTEKEIAANKMGGVLGVSRGSTEKPRFVIMEYLKGKKSEKPIVLIGKGVTFDTGGLNLKPETGIYEMHLDMSGGSVVIHTIAALARNKTKKNIIALIPAVENMPSGSSYRPGDIIKTASGKTIEVLNTDAEGRIILADALEYAKKYNPQLVIDVATLTGSAMAALGQRASAVFSPNKSLVNKLIQAGEKIGDYLWPLPLWEEYEEEIKGAFGDISNVGKTRWGGAITGAVFLWQFIKDYPWIHIDIAPRMTSIEGEYLAKGSAGAGVGVLTKFLTKI